VLVPPERTQLSQHEIDHVLAHYALGQIHSISELAAGSIYSPKVVIESDRGKMLLKRRARGLDIPTMVAFSHEVILGCLMRGVCIPPLLGTIEGNNSMVQFEDHVYELFVFIEGTLFDRSPAMIARCARQAGALLGELHAALDTLRTRFEPSIEPSVFDLSRFAPLEDAAPTIGPSTRAHLKRLLEYGQELALANAHAHALVHGDWHPGNMIYRADQIVAACDFDNTRLGSRWRELAQAMVHFSLKPPTKGQRARECDPAPDRAALTGFWGGYLGACPKACEPRVCAGLMPAVMIDEALASFPSRTGIGAVAGAGDQSDGLMVAVARKAGWMNQHQGELISLLETAQESNQTRS